MRVGPLTGCWCSRAGPYLAGALVGGLLAAVGPRGAPPLAVQAQQPALVLRLQGAHPDLLLLTTLPQLLTTLPQLLHLLGQLLLGSWGHQG